VEDVIERDQPVAPLEVLREVVLHDLMQAVDNRDVFYLPDADFE
jgi:hypothetical protein